MVEGKKEQKILQSMYEIKLSPL